MKTLRIRKLTSEWHPFGGIATAVFFIDGKRFTNTQTGTSERQAKINARLGAQSFFNAITK